MFLENHGDPDVGAQLSHVSFRIEGIVGRTGVHPVEVENLFGANGYRIFQGDFIGDKKENLISSGRGT